MSKKPSREKNPELLVLHAGSLTVPFQHLAEEFMEKNSGILVKRESAGSRACARKIREQNSPADIMASSDSAVIKNLLMPEYADYCIGFATNELVILYGNNSRYSDRIASDMWFDILLKDDVRYGYSDPDEDPCGYRTLLCWKLAERHYNEPGLYRRLVESCPKENIRPKEVDLPDLLENDVLDYVFIYRSVAEQYGKNFLVFPDEINLKSREKEDLYKQVSVEISGEKPGETTTIWGAPILYGITIPKTAANPELAKKFLIFLLSERGQEIMKKFGQLEIISPWAENVENLPPEIKV